MSVIIELPLISDFGIVAEVFEIETGAHVDSCYGYESALTYVQGGSHIAIAVADDTIEFDGEPFVRMTQAELQRKLNHERKLHEDCFGAREIEFAA